MASLTSVQKAEVVRLAQKELRAETEALKRDGCGPVVGDSGAQAPDTAETEKSLKAILGLADHAKGSDAPDAEAGRVPIPSKWHGKLAQAADLAMA